MCTHAIDEDANASNNTITLISMLGLQQLETVEREQCTVRLLLCQCEMVQCARLHICSSGAAGCACHPAERKKRKHT